VNTGESNPVLNSELACDILKLLAGKDEGDYGKNIAEQLGKPQSSICRALTNLTEKDFVERGKRTRAQYYKINYRGISEFWYESLKEELGEESKEHRVLDEEEDKAKEIGEEFFEISIKQCNDPEKVSEILYNTFIYSIGDIITSENDFLKENPVVRCLSEGIIRKLDMHGHPYELKNIVNELEKP